MKVIKNVKLYISGDVIRDIGIIKLYDLLKTIGIEANLERNYLEFSKFSPEVLTNYIINNILLKSYISLQDEEIKELLEEKNLTIEKAIEIIKTTDIKANVKEEIIKGLSNVRFPYMRNSTKFGINGKGNTLERFKEYLNKLIILVIEGNINIKENNLSEYKVKKEVCNICNINHTTELDFTLEERADSKLLFMFKGTVESTFKQNGKSTNNICFECEFLNLMAILYINLDRPVTLAYVNNLVDLHYVNYKIMLKRKMYSDTEFYKIISKNKINTLRLYDFTIDTNKGILLNSTSIIEFTELLLRIELLDLINKYNFSNEAVNKRNLSKTLIENKLYMKVKELLLRNIIFIDSSRTIDDRYTVDNIKSYIRFINRISQGVINKMEYKMPFLEAGKSLSFKMDDAKKKNLSFKLIQLLQTEDRKQILTTIMQVMISYSLEVKRGLVEGITKSDSLRLHENIGVFIEELLQGKKSEEILEDKKEAQ